MEEELEQYLDIIIHINGEWSLEKAFLSKTIKDLSEMMTVELETIKMAKVKWSNFQFIIETVFESLNAVMDARPMPASTGTAAGIYK